MNTFLTLTLKTTSLTRSVALAAIAIGALAQLESANAAQAVPTNGLIGYWAGDGNVTDSSPTGNNGSFSGSYAAGITGQAFDLSTAKVSIPDNPAYSFGPAFSVGFWFNLNATNLSFPQVFLGQDDGSGGNNKWLVFYNGSSTFGLHTNGTSSENLYSDPGNLANGWNQLTLVKDNSNYSFYLNGNNIGDRSSLPIIPDPVTLITFGIAEGSFNYDGLLENVVLYNRALTGSEVQTLAIANTVPIPAAIWLFGSALVGLVGLGCRKTFL